MAALSGITWEFSETTEWGWAWGSYEPDAASKLEEAFVSGQDMVHIRNETGGVQRTGSAYEVNLEDMRQINMRSGYERLVRRVSDGTHAPPGEAWEWRCDNGDWHPYDVAACEALRIRRASGHEDVTIHVDIHDGPGTRLAPVPSTVVVDTSALTQWTRRGRVTRSVRRNAERALPPVTAPPPPVLTSRVRESSSVSAAAAARETALAEDCTSACANDESCAVCLEGFTMGEHRAMRLRLCGGGHYLHRACIAQVFSIMGPKCPTCSVMYGTLQGDQPDGTMTISTSSSVHCSGHSSVDTIILRYHFSSGVQGPRHPCPGARYSGTSRAAYLPDSNEGREVALLLRRCFDQRLTFIIGTSVTTGVSNTVVWNGVHHKTQLQGGSAQFGWPDHTYFERVKAELAAKGVV